MAYTPNEIHHAEALSFMGALPDKSIDMILTSPPYDNLRDYNGFTWDFEGIAKESYRVLKDGGVLVWVVNDSVVNGSETLTSFRQALYFVDVCGFKMHDTMIYAKNAIPFPDVSRYHACFEYMFVLSKSKPKTVNLLKELPNSQGNKKITSTNRQTNGETEYSHGRKTGKAISEYGAYSNVWVLETGYMKSTSDEIAYEHPAIFPEELARRHILTWSNEGDTVLDYFSGSGTTAKIASIHNRNFYACDLSPEYVALAKERLLRADPYQHKPLSTGGKQLSLLHGLE